MNNLKNPTEDFLRIENLTVNFPVKGAMPFSKQKVEALTDVSIRVSKGDTFGIVGESGCGKSTLGNSILGLVPVTGGKIYFKGQDTVSLNRAEFRKARQKMQMIFQNPSSSLNPRFSVFQIVSEPMKIRGGYSKEQTEARVIELLKLVGLSESDMNRYASESSGGQKQRIGIARAIALDPELLVCDEPVSALDVSVHAQILNLLSDLQEQLDITYLFISHNLAVVKNICNSMAVMYLGNIMEYGDTKTIFSNTLHPYTKALISAVLDINPDSVSKRIILKGDIPSAINPPKGCRFCKRCPDAKPGCEMEKPVLREVEKGHFVACHSIDD